MGRYNDDCLKQYIQTESIDRQRHAMQQGMTNSPLGSTPTDSSATKIRDGVTYLEGQVAELHEVISLLEKRLDTVLTPVGPAVVSNAGQGTAPAANSHLFDRLGDLTNTVVGAKQRLVDLRMRVEV